MFLYRDEWLVLSPYGWMSLYVYDEYWLLLYIHYFILHLSSPDQEKKIPLPRPPYLSIIENTLQNVDITTL